MSAEFTFEFDPNFDFILEERANTYMALRKVKWGSSEEFKLDLRKYQATESGERMLKGCTFISDEGAHELTKVLLEQQFGRPNEIVNSIKQTRPDIYAEFVRDIKDIPSDKAKEIVDSAEESSQQYYDMRDII